MSDDQRYHLKNDTGSNKLALGTLDCRINGRVPNKLVGVKKFSDQYEKFPKGRLGGGWKEAKNDYLGQ